MPAEPASERVFWIVGARRRARLRLQGSFFVIGRGEPVPVFQDDPQISREHATVVATKGGVRVKDLGSRNGAFVNGKRLERWAEVTLSERDVLLVGSTEVRLLGSKEAEAPHDGDDLRVDAEGVIRAVRLVARAAPDATAPRTPVGAPPAADAGDDEVKDVILDPGSSDDLSVEDDPLRTADALEDEAADATGARVPPDLPPGDADELEGEVTHELDPPGSEPAPIPGAAGAGLEPDGLGEAPTADGRATTPQAIPAVGDRPTDEADEPDERRLEPEE